MGKLQQKIKVLFFILKSQFMNNSSSEFSQEEVEKQQIPQNIMAKAIVKLEARLETVEIKLFSLTNVVRLLQQYTQKKDIQYEKECENMHSIYSKLATIDQIQSQFIHQNKKYDQFFQYQHSYVQKMEQINKAVQDRQAAQKALEERIEYQVEELSKRIGKIETNLLTQIRESNKNQQLKGNNNVSNSYVFEELTFKMEMLENKIWNAHLKLQNKIQKLSQQPKKIKDNNQQYYGLMQKNVKEISRQTSRNKQNKSIKRLKSR